MPTHQGSPSPPPTSTITSESWEPDVAYSNYQMLDREEYAYLVKAHIDASPESSSTGSGDDDGASSLPHHTKSQPKYVRLEKWYESEDDAQILPTQSVAQKSRSSHTSVRRPSRSRRNEHGRWADTDPAAKPYGAERTPGKAKYSTTSEVREIIERHQKASRLLDDEVTRYTHIKDKEFENAARRLCWTSEIPSEVFDQVLKAHNEKQAAKRRIQKHGTNKANGRPKQEPEPALGDEETESDDTASTMRQHPKHSEQAATSFPNQAITKVVTRFTSHDCHQHKMDIPSGTSFILVTGPSGRVEFKAADGTLRHVEEWLPNDNDDILPSDDFPDAPSPPPTL